MDALRDVLVRRVKRGGPAAFTAGFAPTCCRLQRVFAPMAAATAVLTPLPALSHEQWCQTYRNGLREMVVPRRRRAGQRLTDMNNKYYIERVCCICVRYRERCAQTRSMLPHLIRLHA